MRPPPPTARSFDHAPSFVAAGATALFVEGSPADKDVPRELKSEKKAEKIQGTQTAKKPAEM